VNKKLTDEEIVEELRKIRIALETLLESKALMAKYEQRLLKKGFPIT